MRLISRRALAVLVVLSLSAATASCKRGDDDDKAGSTTTTLPGPTTTAPTTTSAAPPGSPPAPLTGVPQGDPAKQARPALVVKIDNAPVARPQAGLLEADIVYEEQAEGGVTRLMAVYQSTDAEPIGPVRSYRPTDLPLLQTFSKPLFGYSGANYVYGRVLTASGAVIDVGIDKQQKAYTRDRKRKAPSNLFTSGPALYAKTPAGATAPKPVLQFRGAGVAFGGAPVSRVALDYKDRVQTAVAYEWDATAAGWKRIQNGTPHVDVADRQVTPKNVVVQFVRYDKTKFVDQSGAAVLEAKLEGGSGEAWFLSDGRIVKGRWAKPAKGLITYTDAAGKPVLLTPGQTWVELVPPGQAVAS